MDNAHICPNTDTKWINSMLRYSTGYLGKYYMTHKSSRQNAADHTRRPVERKSNACCCQSFLGSDSEINFFLFNPIRMRPHWFVIITGLKRMNGALLYIRHLLRCSLPRRCVIHSIRCACLCLWLNGDPPYYRHRHRCRSSHVLQTITESHTWIFFCLTLVVIHVPPDKADSIHFRATVHAFACRQIFAHIWSKYLVDVAVITNEPRCWISNSAQKWCIQKIWNTSKKKNMNDKRKKEIHIKKKGSTFLSKGNWLVKLYTNAFSFPSLQLLYNHNIIPWLWFASLAKLLFKDHPTWQIIWVAPHIGTILLCVSALALLV